MIDIDRDKYFTSCNVGIVGAGYVGLVVAGILSERGHYVGVYDINKDKLNILNQGKIYISEPHLEEYFDRNKRNAIEIYDSLEELVLYKNIIFVTVGTPNGTEYVDQVAKDIGTALRSRKDYPRRYIILKSTVPPTYVSKFAQTIKSYAGGEIPVIYNPEFLSEGNATCDMTYPDKLVIGTKDGKIPHKIRELYEKVYPDMNKILISTTWENAAMIKYANNAFLASKITFINQIADVCENIPNCDVNVVAKGIGYDDRISPKFLKAGLGYGGSCLTKDIKAMLDFHEMPLKMLETVNMCNYGRRFIPRDIMWNVWKSEDFKHKTIAILGLSFKPNTDDIRDSPAITIIDQILKNKVFEGMRINVYDPKATEDFKNLYSGVGTKLVRCPSAKYALKGADMAIICTDWDEFKTLDADDFKLLMNDPIVIDGRRLYDPEKLIREGIKYYGIGYGNNAINRKKASKSN